MRRSFLLTSAALAGALALGCTDQPTPTGPSDDPALSPPALARQTVQRVTFDEPWEQDITNPCTGEVVHFTGRLVEQQTHLAGDIHIEIQHLLTGTGTSTVTGTTYAVRESAHLSFNSPSVPAVNFIFKIVSTAHGVAPGSEDNFIIHFRFNMTVTPSGAVPTEVEVESAECRG